MRAKWVALDRRAANLGINQLHTLTTTLTRRYGTIVVEDLDVQAMGRGMGRRAFGRSAYQAGIGKVRPTLAYKCGQQGGRLVVADRWFGSSKTITVAAATWPILGWTNGTGSVLSAGCWWTATPTRR
jgi:putative transposase